MENSYSITIDRNSRFTRSENIWVEAEHYFYGKIVNAGGKENANIHLLTSKYGIIKIKTPIDFLQGQEENILYKNLGVRVKGKQNIKSGEVDLVDLEIIDFINYNPSYDEEYLKSLREKAKKSWVGKTNMVELLNEIRGYGV